MAHANPIHAMLDDAGVPWLAVRGELERQFGIAPHPAYLWEVIEIKTARPFVEGLIWPISVQTFGNLSPHVPATDFTGTVSFGPDARKNLRLTTDRVTRGLGQPATAGSSNTLGKEWSYGPSRLTLTVWPPDMQRFPMTNPSHGREPRLVTACHLSIKTGWRPLMTDEETQWLAKFEPLAAITAGPIFQPNEPAEQSQLEFLREPNVDVREIFGHVGVSGGQEALVFCHSQLYVVSMSDIVGFHVERLRPAKGSGGSRLYVECETNYGRHQTKRLLINSSDAVEGLNDLAAELSRVSSKPFELGPYYNDD